MIKVSIIVPIYRIKVPYLKECIESLLMQTCKEIEIILIDDGSEDECGTICDEYALLDNRIKVIHQENQGVSVARNRGIQLARGEWVTFVDGDDKAEPEMIDKIYEYAKKYDADIAMFSNYVHKEGRVYEHPFFAENIQYFDERLREEFQIRTMILHYPDCSYHPKYMLTGHTFGKLIRREYLLNSRVLFKPELLLQQDGIFYLHLSQQGGNMVYFNVPLYHYRVYDTSSCKRVRADMDEIYNRVRMAFLDFIKENNKPHAYIAAYYAKCITDISHIIKNDFFNEIYEERVFSRLKRLKVFLSKEPYSIAIRNVDKMYLTRLKRRNLYYYRHKLLWVLWIDWKIYCLKHQD